MFHGRRHEDRENIRSPDAIFIQDSKKVGHVLLKSFALWENRVYLGGRAYNYLKESAMFCKTACDWSINFARISDLKIGPSDWSNRFLIVDQSKRVDFQTCWVGNFERKIFYIGERVQLTSVTKCDWVTRRVVAITQVCWIRSVQTVLVKVSEKGVAPRIASVSGRIRKDRLLRIRGSLSELIRNLHFSLSSQVSVRLPGLSSPDLIPSMVGTRRSQLPVATPSAYIRKAAAPSPKSNKQKKREEKKKYQQELARSWLEELKRKTEKRGKAEKVLLSESDEEFTGFEMSDEDTTTNVQESNQEQQNEPESVITEEVAKISFAEAVASTSDDRGMTNDWADPNNGGAPITVEEVEEGEEDQEDDSTVLQLFGIGEAMKFRIAALLEDKVLTMEVDEDTVVTIEDKDLQVVKDLNKTTITRFMLKADCEEDFMAEKPTSDIVDDFLFFSDGLGLPPEMVPQKAVLVNKDGKEKKVKGQIYPTGQKQLWELQVTTWMDLNLNMVCGKKSFSLGSGNDKWTVFAPGEFKNQEPTYYAFGICKDPTITNVQIARQLKKQGFEIHQDLKGVKDSPKQSFDTSKTGGKYFFLKTEITKKEDGEYNKINIGVYSNNLKKNVPITFTVRDKKEKTKKEAQEEQPKRCRACGNEKEKCSGVEEIHCSWKDVNIIEWMAKKKEQFKEIKPFVKNAVVTPVAAVTDAEFKVKKYLSRIREDLAEERVIRIRSLLAHNVKMEAERQRDGTKKDMDEVGFIKVEKKSNQQRVLKRTVHKPFKIADFKVVANFTGQFGNKDKIIATLYKWPTRNYEGSRIKALAADLNLKQLSELATKCGAKENKSATAIEKLESIQDESKRKLGYAGWIDAHVQALEMMICVPE